MTDYSRLALPGISQIAPYQPGKPQEELERELGVRDVVKLASNENPLGPSKRVIAGLGKELPELARYPDGSAYKLKRRLGEFIGTPPECLTIGNGSNDVLELVARTLLAPGLETVVFAHSFVVYPLVTQALGAQLKVAPTPDYRQEADAILEAVGPKTRLVFIANPNNPTGAWVTGAALRRLLGELPKEVILVLDEAYREYAAVEDYPNGLEFLPDHPNLMVTRTFSKAYGLAGLRLGYAASHPELADLMNRIRQPFNVNALSLAAALIALDDQQHVEKSVRLNREGMAYLVPALEELGLRCLPSAGNFIAFDCGRPGWALYEALLREGVIARPLDSYGMPQHLRVTVGTMPENKRFIAALQKVLEAS